MSKVMGKRWCRREDTTINSRSQWLTLVILAEVGRNREDHSSRPAQAKMFVRPHLKGMAVCTCNPSYAGG
jgi:hypothetical protein